MQPLLLLLAPRCQHTRDPVSLPLHITSGDRAGDALAGAGLDGDILVWHDLLYDGPRTTGWPDDDNLLRRAVFIEEMTGGGLARQEILHTFASQYERIAALPPEANVVLWFDACLFDQSMLVHILNCLQYRSVTRRVELLCIDQFPGITPFIGLGQLSSDQLASCYHARIPVSRPQFDFGCQVDAVFAERDLARAALISSQGQAPLRWVPTALSRWLQEQPDQETGLGRLETMALEAIRGGRAKPWEIFKRVAATETDPQFWGDTTLWTKINGLADRRPPLVRIKGPKSRLPQWIGESNLDQFEITAC